MKSIKSLIFSVAVLATLVITSDIFFLHGLSRALLSLIGIHI